jgi:hypothetical protein
MVWRDNFYFFSSSSIKVLRSVDKLSTTLLISPTVQGSEEFPEVGLE